MNHVAYAVTNTSRGGTNAVCETISKQPHRINRAFYGTNNTIYISPSIKCLYPIANRSSTRAFHELNNAFSWSCAEISLHFIGK